jgi:S1-C subfamily serine protease/tRNA nucleotidyltransferase/poly(A) polymerase
LLFLFGSQIRVSLAFQSELFTQAINAVNTLNFVDDLFFAAVNLVDKAPPSVPLIWEPSSVTSKLNVPPLPQFSLTINENDHSDTPSQAFLYDYEATPLPRSLALTQMEQELFELLLTVRQIYCPSTTIRVAGGWVRDKLLGQTHNLRDIDIVLSDLSGVDFGNLIQQYITDNPNHSLKRYADHQIQIKHYENSSAQHLQTASLSFGELQVDLGRLRYETYRQSNSRVPTMTGRAAPIQDAYRRDLTVNALYFNLHTSQVEDWTEQGLQDLLQTRRIATPQPALESLLEDPLRILRAARFAAQLSFVSTSLNSCRGHTYTWHPDLQRAVADRRVLNAFYTKVSPHRRGTEVNALFGTVRPSLGLNWLLPHADLLQAIFGLPTDKRGIFLYQQGYRNLVASERLIRLCGLKNNEHLFYAAWLHPHWQSSKENEHESLTKRHRQNESIVNKCLLKSLARSRSDAQAVQRILDGLSLWHSLRNNFDKIVAEQNTEQFDTNHLPALRWEVYKLLKKTGPSWRESLLLSYAVAESQGSDAKTTASSYFQWIDFIEKDSLLSQISLNKDFVKPIFNGKQIKERALPCLVGEKFREALQAQEEWQVKHGFANAGLKIIDVEQEKMEQDLIQYLIEKFPDLSSQEMPHGNGTNTESIDSLGFPTEGAKFSKKVVQTFGTRSKIQSKEVVLDSTRRLTFSTPMLVAVSNILGLSQPSSALDDYENKRIAIFEKASPSVVFIDTFTERRDAFSTNVLEVPLGSGSGFVWDKEGHIVTNFHVVRNAQVAQIAILTSDSSGSTASSSSLNTNINGFTSMRGSNKRSVFKAQVVGVDPGKDVAVLKVDAPKELLTPLKAGQSAKLKVGQSVLAIGNPFGLDHSLTSGIISGLGREVKSPIGRPITNVIQIDAAINPGNSGGPLLDSSGNLIGMNTAIYSPSGASAGVGFAIPIDAIKSSTWYLTVSLFFWMNALTNLFGFSHFFCNGEFYPVVETLITDGQVVRAVLGISYLESKQARALGINAGVLVLDVPENSPAALAGLKGTRRTESGLIEIGDIILKVEDNIINTESDLFAALEDRKPGEKVKLTVGRAVASDNELVLKQVELIIELQPSTIYERRKEKADVIISP